MRRVRFAVGLRRSSHRFDYLMLSSKRRRVASFAIFVAISLTTVTHAQVGYWHTKGNQILDSNGKVVRIAGVNWYGFETDPENVAGLWAQDYRQILNAIQSNGYNVIRIPFSNQMVESPVIPTDIAYRNGSGPINTDLSGLNSLQILDKIVAYARQIGLKVILDNHRSEAGSSAEANGLWYTSQYPESSWIADWVALATRYLGNSTVIGMDLRNEPHLAFGGGSCWGCGSQAYDWRLAAERGGNAILAVNPNLLIFVEGTDCYGNDCDWWGGNLEGAQAFPVTLNVANRLVYSAHDYGPNLYQQGWFNSNTTYVSLVALWTKFWAYLSLNGIAPVWVGEFGTTNNPSDIQSNVPGSQGQWFQSMVTFLQSNPQLDWTYWALNGEDEYGLLDFAYDSTPASALKQQVLASIQFNVALSVTRVGSGTVISADGHINCGSTCSFLYPQGTMVGLTATPAVGSTLSGWTGCTAASGNFCAVSISAAQNVTATFSASQVTVATLILAPSTVKGGRFSVATVTLAGPAPAGGMGVGIASSNPRVAHTPASVVVPGGTNSTRFVVRTSLIRANTVVTITAAANGTHANGTLTVNAP